MSTLGPSRHYVEDIRTSTLPFQGIEAIHETLDQVDLTYREYFLLGGANLVLRGIISATQDIDMLVSGTGFEKLAQEPGAEIKDPPVNAIANGATNKTIWVRNRQTLMPISATEELGDGYYPMSFESHVDRTELVDGVPCSILDDVRRAKEALRRTKDIPHLQAIARFQGKPEPRWAVVDEDYFES